MIRIRSDLRFFFITKRIDRLMQVLPPDWGGGYENLAVGCTVENQAMADYRLPLLLDAPLRHKLVICAPLLATGYSAAHAVDVLKKRGVPGTSIRFLALVSAPEGVAVMQKLHPDVEIYVASLDEKLDENAYIVPGLGDAGDRLFGTK